MNCNLRDCIRNIYRWLIHTAAIGAAVMAIFQLWQNNRIAVTSNTLTLVAEVESRDFETAYHHVMEWLAVNDGLPTKAADSDVRRDLNYILNKYANLSTFVERGGIVDANVIGATVGIRLPGFWKVVGPRLNDHNEYDVIGAFVVHRCK
jgi:hypothetical protein